MKPELPVMTHDRSIMAATSLTSSIFEQFIEMMTDELRALYKLGNFNSKSRMLEIIPDEMTIDEIKEFLSFEAYLITKFHLLFDMFKEQIDKTDLIARKITAERTQN